MIAGYDTTACGTSHVLYCLANYEDVQAKVRMEIDSIFKQNQGEIIKNVQISMLA